MYSADKTKLLKLSLTIFFITFRYVTAQKH